MFEKLKELLDETQRLGVPAMDILVYHEGKEVFRDLRGVSDEQGTSVNGAELYNIYSCSKIITCVAALKLVEEGKLSLQDELAEYLPCFSDMKVKKNGGVFKAENKIKIENLFTMTAGLNYATASEEVLQGKRETDGKCPTVEMMNYIAKMPLEYEPGESWLYSLAHDVLAAVVEKISGKKFGQYVRENIFHPLGMEQSTFLLPDEKLNKVCAQFRWDGEDNFVNVGRKIQYYKFGSEYESGGAGCISTTEEYVRFLEGLRTGKLISLETIARMQKDCMTDEQRKACWIPQDYAYGLGVRVPIVGGRRTDFGWGGAAGAYAAVDMKNQISLYYAQHVLQTPNRNLRKDIIEAVKLDLGKDAFKEDMWHGVGSTLA